MKYDSTIKMSQAVSESVLDRIKEEGLAPTPENYELWYAFYADVSMDVKRAISMLEASKKKITNAHCLEIHERFLSDAKTQETVKRTGDDLQKTMTEISDLVRDVRTATSSYGESLEGVNKHLAEVKDWDNLEAILKNIMTDTQEMVARNKELEDQLDRSSNAIETLNKDLENVRREALTDGLTGIGNRKSFDQKIKDIASTAAENGSVYSLLMVDIDHFKAFNDNFGHQVGDQVLRLVARVLVDNIKGRDVACRYGGEEFAVVLPDTPLQAAVSVADVLRKAVGGKEIMNRVSGESLGRITMSLGAAEAVTGENIEDLIERADAAMYTAKQNGRNQVAAAPAPSLASVPNSMTDKTAGDRQTSQTN